MFNKLLNYLVRKIKKDPFYSVDEKIDFHSFICLVKLKGFTLTKGIFYQLIRFKRPVVLFLGKGVVINHANKLCFKGVATIGNMVTIDCLGKVGVTLGENVTIPDGCFIRCTGVITDLGQGVAIGNNTGLGHYNFINGQGGVVIGDDVIIGPYVKILSENHKFDRIDTPIRLQGVSRVGIKIHSDVWIGANVTILDGVEIGKGSIIGAGSIVTRSIPEYSLAVGSPCKVLKNRKSNL